MSNRPTSVVAATQQARGASPNHHPSEQEIAIRAHELFLERGCADGHDIEDWLEAERELIEKGKAQVPQQISSRHRV